MICKVKRGGSSVKGYFKNRTFVRLFSLGYVSICALTQIVEKRQRILRKYFSGIYKGLALPIEWKYILKMKVLFLIEQLFAQAIIKSITASSEWIFYVISSKTSFDSLFHKLYRYDLSS